MGDIPDLACLCKILCIGYMYKFSDQTPTRILEVIQNNMISLVALKVILQSHKFVAFQKRKIQEKKKVAILSLQQLLTSRSR
jgi:hypothetical protein